MSDLILGKPRVTIIGAADIGNSPTDSRRARIMAGLERARGRGIRLGRPRILIDMNRVLALRADGRSLEAVGRALGVSAMTISRMLANARPGATVATKIIDGGRGEKIDGANRRFLAMRVREKGTALSAASSQLNGVV
jgi:DNA-binding CsgD family transcriptional regulator